MKGKATRGNVVNYGEFGLAAVEPGWITSNQIEAARIAMTRFTKRNGKGQHRNAKLFSDILRQIANTVGRNNNFLAHSFSLFFLQITHQTAAHQCR